MKKLHAPDDLIFRTMLYQALDSRRTYNREAISRHLLYVEFWKKVSIQEVALNRERHLQ